MPGKEARRRNDSVRKSPDQHSADQCHSSRDDCGRNDSPPGDPTQPDGHVESTTSAVGTRASTGPPKPGAVEVVESNAGIRRRIINLGTPALAEMMLMTFVSMADLIQVGRLGPWAITSVGLSTQPMFVAMSVFMSLNVGATALVARFIGAGKPKDASAVARQALMIATAMGAALAVVGCLSARTVLLWMGAGSDVIKPGSDYLRIVAAGLLFQGPAISLSASLRGAGDTRTPMWANTIGNLVNVAGNWLLITGHLGFPRLEVVGAAIPTFISRVLACAIVMWKVFSGSGAIRLSVHDSFRPDGSVIRRVLKLGLPAAGEQLVMRSGQMLFARIVSSFGTAVYAAHQVALNVEGLSLNLGLGFRSATTALVGQSLGAANPKRAERVGVQSCNIGIAASIVLGSVFFFLGRFVVLLYTNDPTVVSLSAGCLRIIALAQPFMATNFILIGVLYGAGDTRWAMYVTLAGIWGARVLVAYVLADRLGMGLSGAWIGMAMDMVVRAIVVSCRFRAGQWKTIRV